MIAESRLDRKLRRPDRARDAAWKSTAAAFCRACSTHASTAAIAEGLRTGRLGRMSEPDSDRAGGSGISQPADRAGPWDRADRDAVESNKRIHARRRRGRRLVFLFFLSGKKFFFFREGPGMETDHGRATSRAGSPLIAEASGATHPRSPRASPTSPTPSPRGGPGADSRREGAPGGGGGGSGGTRHGGALINSVRPSYDSRKGVLAYARVCLSGPGV